MTYNQILAATALLARDASNFLKENKKSVDRIDNKKFHGAKKSLIYLLCKAFPYHCHHAMQINVNRPNIPNPLFKFIFFLGQHSVLFYLPAAHDPSKFNITSEEIEIVDGLVKPTSAVYQFKNVDQILSFTKIVNDFTSLIQMKGGSDFKLKPILELELFISENYHSELMSNILEIE